MRLFFDESNAALVRDFCAEAVGGLALFVTDETEIWHGVARYEIVERFRSLHETGRGAKLRQVSQQQILLDDGTAVRLFHAAGEDSLARLLGMLLQTAWVWGNFGYKNGLLAQTLETLHRVAKPVG